MNSFEKEGFRRKLANLLEEYEDLSTGEDEQMIQLTSSLLKETKNYGQPRPCCSCGKMLDCLPEVGDWSSYQPVNGCEIKIVGSYGSSSHDMKELRGIICDECVSKLNLERESFYV